MLAKSTQYIIPYSDLVEMFYISLCNRFTQPNNPSVSIMGYSELEYLIKECYNGMLYEIAGNSSYVANLDETLFFMMREKFKQALFFMGFGDLQRHVNWWDNYIEESLFPKIIERVNILRSLGSMKSHIDWLFDQGCVLVHV